MLHRAAAAWRPSLLARRSTAVGSSPAAAYQPLMRTNIGIFGAMNSGKSTLMNAITQQATSIVDATPGTTADAKSAMMELHAVGPVKLVDTPGVDESGELGRKKRAKAVSVLRESDAFVVVVNPASLASVESACDVLDHAAREAGPGAKPLILLNIRGETSQEVVDAAVRALGPRAAGAPRLVVDLVRDGEATNKVAKWLQENVGRKQNAAPLLPKGVEMGEGSVVLLNIPMDEETPSGRLLRPQSMMQEALLRKFVGTFAHRMHLGRARGKLGQGEREVEERRFRELVETLKTNGRLKLLITDSQAMDIVHPWTLERDGKETVPITTFSVAMANYLSGGALPRFVEGLGAFERLQKGDRVLICEACNHNRILDDIGITQIPKAIAKRFGQGVVQVDHAFGRECEDRDLARYKLLIHCGGCMLDVQKMASRLSSLDRHKVPITNYGLLLSLLQSRGALSRVLAPWDLTLKT